MEMLAEIVISALLVIGGLFGVIGGFGLIKLPDPMTRLHAPTLASTVGTGSILFASMLWFSVYGDHVSWHELLIVLFLFLTAPITGLMIAKAHLHLTWQEEELPDTGVTEPWCTYGDSAEDPGGKPHHRTQKPQISPSAPAPMPGPAPTS